MRISFSLKLEVYKLFVVKYPENITAENNHDNNERIII
jgi:hypothetical protein